MLLSSQKHAFDQNSMSRALESACLYNDIDCIEFLLDAGGVRIVKPAHFNSLLRCKSADPIDTWNLLLNAVSNYENQVGWDAFMVVVMSGWYNCTKSLLSVWKPSKEYLEIHRDEGCEFPLVYSCSSRNRDTRMLQLLLDSGFGERRSDVKGALRWACQSRNLDAVRLLLEDSDFGFRFVDNEIVREVPYTSSSETEMIACTAILELLLAQDLSTVYAEDNIVPAVFTSVGPPNVEYINALLCHEAEPPFAEDLSKEMEVTFCHIEVSQERLLHTADALAAVRKAGTETELLLVRHSAKREASEGTIPGLQALVLSGADVNACKKDKPVIYLVAAKHYDPVLISFMLQSGAEFDAAALVKCVTREHKYEVRSLIDTFSTMKN
jgi:hypothetical protein